MLKKLLLQNFQKHEQLEIDFSEGVTALYGASEKGKSCIRRGIEFLCEHQTFKGQRKIGTKKTSVKGWFKDNICVERIISNSINRYVITKDGEEQIFDSVGRSAPEEVRKVIGIYPFNIDGEEIYLNSYPQIGLPFLFDKSPSFRMKLFNKLTGNDVLDKLFGEFNKDILRIKKNKKEEIERFENREPELKTKKIKLEQAEAVHDRLIKRIKNIKILHEKYAKLLRLKELQAGNSSDQADVLSKLENTKFPQPEVIKQLASKIDKFTALVTHKNSSEKVFLGLNRVRKQIKDLKPLSINIGELRAKIDRFAKIEAIYEKKSQNQALFVEITKNIKISDMDYHSSVNNYKRLLKEIKVCPICQNKLTDEHVKEIHL